jgi:hypothetical protein
VYDRRSVDERWRDEQTGPYYQRRDQGQSRGGVDRWKGTLGPLHEREFLLVLAFSSFFTKAYAISLKLQIEASRDIDEEIDGIIQMQMEKHPHQLLHTVMFL